MIKCSFSPGLTKPLTFGASAQAILAHLPAERVAAVSEAHQLTAERLAALHLELRRVRDRGYAVSTGAVDEGVWASACPSSTGSAR
ncbi:IclR family transcriptional regulator C-terminal domain-containing protein [Streptomyces sp. M10(2022)]